MGCCIFNTKGSNLQNIVERYRTECINQCQPIHSNIQCWQIPDDLLGFQRYGNGALQPLQWVFRVVLGVDRLVVDDTAALVGVTAYRSTVQSNAVLA